MPTYKGVCQETILLRPASCIEVDGGGFENLSSFDSDMYFPTSKRRIFLNNKSLHGEVVQLLSFIPYMDFV
jgi:hypothetical protein